MSERDVGQLHSADDLIAAVEQYGFLPFFRNEIHGFSIEELCPPELWFADDVDGPWEWKGPAARSGKCLYGKLFNKKAGFVSREWIPDFANFRRDGYDFDARWDDGLASYKDKELYEAIDGEGGMLSKRLKEALNYRKGGNTGFETCITRLQMQSYVCIADFVYMQDRYGRPYGWGVAEYATPEELFGYDFITSAYQRDPQESKERILKHLQSRLPNVEGRKVKEICRRHRALFIINDRVDVARLLEADGVHLGKEDMDPWEARRILGPGKIVGATCNTWDDILLRQKQQVDYIGLGPYAFTTTKEKLSPVLGLEGYRFLLGRMQENKISIPVFAIGGITETDIPPLMQTGIQGIALSIPSNVLNAMVCDSKRNRSLSRSGIRIYPKYEFSNIIK